MTKGPLVVSLAEMTSVLEANPADLTRAIERGFVAYSRGEAVVPPVGELLFDQPPGDVHIKYGYLKGEPHYVIKVASSFYDNPKLGLDSSGGVMLIFSARTGGLEAVLLDDGYLTNVRTAITGRIAAVRLANSEPRRIGIIGTGIQARLQLQHLMPFTSCRRCMVWGRTDDATKRFQRDMSTLGFDVQIAPSVTALARECDLIVTTTPARTPYLRAEHLRPGMHVTAVGADSPGKQEIDASFIAGADIVVCDSRVQCAERGDVAHAVRDGSISIASLPELGEILDGTHAGRTTSDQITVADLTGVAVQDVQIASFVLERLLNRR